MTRNPLKPMRIALPIERYSDLMRIAADHQCSINQMGEKIILGYIAQQQKRAAGSETATSGAS